jgi:pseudaminic acid biosynthesis-associated methylase
MNFKTEQEAFWAGSFGTDYIGRNSGDALLASNLRFFGRALAAAGPLESCLEFGANVGMNLRALQLLYPGQSQHAVEINADAVARLRDVVPSERIFQGSMLDYEPAGQFDLVLIKGVLIHVDPAVLPAAYERLHRSTGRFLLVCEYYNQTPVAIPYRGHENRLFKRDFGGELLDAYPDLRLVDYGFAYRRDPAFPQDDITWFLMRKGS